MSFRLSSVKYKNIQNQNFYQEDSKYKQDSQYVMYELYLEFLFDLIYIVWFLYDQHFLTLITGEKEKGKQGTNGCRSIEGV